MSTTKNTPSASGSDILRFEANQIIFEEGDAADCAYMIRSGSVLIVKRNPGADVVLVQLKPNQAFGELALIDKTPRSAAAVAAEPTELMVVTAANFLAKIAALDPFMSNWFRFLKHRILDLSDQVEQ